MDEDEFVCYIWDFKKPMRDIRNHLKEQFPELLSRLVSAWKINGTSWEVKFKKAKKDEL